MAAQNSFFRRFVNREPQAASTDPADMGTAFGLDASLSGFDADDSTATVPAAGREHAPLDWLTQRHGPRRNDRS